MDLSLEKNLILFFLQKSFKKQQNSIKYKKIIK